MSALVGRDDEEIAMMRKRFIGVTWVDGGLSNPQFGAVCVGRLVAMAGRAAAWFGGMDCANKKLCGTL
ncbi:hypothetical protein ENH_00018790, partial [Eimeria necatrix]